MLLEPAHERRGDDRDDGADRDRVRDRRGEAEDPDDADKQGEDADEKPRHEAEVAQPGRRLEHALEMTRFEEARLRRCDLLHRWLGLPSAEQPQVLNASPHLGRRRPSLSTIRCDERPGADTRARAGEARSRQALVAARPRDSRSSVRGVLLRRLPPGTDDRAEAELAADGQRDHLRGRAAGDATLRGTVRPEARSTSGCPTPGRRPRRSSPGPRGRTSSRRSSPTSSRPTPRCTSSCSGGVKGRSAPSSPTSSCRR